MNMSVGFVSLGTRVVCWFEEVSVAEADVHIRTLFPTNRRMVSVITLNT